MNEKNENSAFTFFGLREWLLNIETKWVVYEHHPTHRKTEHGYVRTHGLHVHARKRFVVSLET